MASRQSFNDRTVRAPSIAVKGEKRTSKAVWPPIVDQSTFEKAENILKKTAKFRRSRYLSGQRYPFLLAGLVSCAHCGDRLPGKSAHGNGGKIPYYEHGWAVKRQSCLNKKFFDHWPTRVLASKLESEVWGKVLRLLSDSEMAKTIIDEANKVHEAKSHSKEADRLRNKVKGVGEQIEALTEHLAKISKDVSPEPVFAHMRKLQELRSSTQKELDEIASSGCGTEMPATLSDYQALLSSLKGLYEKNGGAELRAKIVQRLIHKVEILPEGYRIHYFAGRSAIQESLELSHHAASDGNGSRNNFSVYGSKKILNGWGTRSRT